MAQERFEWEGSTHKLCDWLCQVREEVKWAEKALRTFDLILTSYGLYNDLGEDRPTHARSLLFKIKELERLMTLDLMRHLASSVGREPYYFARLDRPLERVLDSALSLESAAFPARDFEHLSAELQAACLEYKLCSSLESISNSDEASAKLEVLSGRLSALEQAASIAGDRDLDEILGSLQAAVADIHGLRQALTENNIARLRQFFVTLFTRTQTLESSLCETLLAPQSVLCLRYRAVQHLLRRPLVEALPHHNNTLLVNSHVIHPGTRGWILDRFTHTLANQQKRVFVLSGKEGSGKSALASAVCKLHSCTVASYFFERNHGADQAGVRALVEGLAHEMCHNLPEYLNYLDDTIGADSLHSDSEVLWKTRYEILLKKPLQSLYGIGRTAVLSSQRKLVVLDGVEACSPKEWVDLCAFLGALVSDTHPMFMFLITVRSEPTRELLPSSWDFSTMEHVGLEDKCFINRHIRDLELYLASSMGSVLSGEDEKDSPDHAKVDLGTLQRSIDELLKASAGRFDYAVSLSETFARDMSTSGQFLGSVKKALGPVSQSHGERFEQRVTEFASPYRSYRDREGRTVDVRVIRQSQFLKDKTRVALIRGRHRWQVEKQKGQNST